MKPEEIINYLEMVRPTENYSHTFSVSVGNTRHFGPGSQLNKDVSTAIDLAIKSLEKEVPKKPKKLSYEPLIRHGWEYECPECSKAIGINSVGFDFTDEDPFCPSCGQKINWKETP